MRPIPGGRALDGYADDSNLESDRPSLARKLASPGRGSSRQAPPGRPPIGRSFGTSMSEDLGQILRSQSVTSNSEGVRPPFRDALHPRCDHRVDLSLGVPPLRQHQLRKHRRALLLLLLPGLNGFAFGCHPHIRNAGFARFRSLLQWLMMMRAWPGEDSALRNPGLWKGAKQISTRRAGGVDPEGGRWRAFPVGRMWDEGQGSPHSTGFPWEIHRLLQAGTRTSRSRSCLEGGYPNIRTTWGKLTNSARITNPHNRVPSRRTASATFIPGFRPVDGT